MVPVEKEGLVGLGLPTGGLDGFVVVGPPDSATLGFELVAGPGDGAGDTAGPADTVELGETVGTVDTAGPAAAIVGEPPGPVLPVDGAKATGALPCAAAAGGAPTEVGADDDGIPVLAAAPAGASIGGATEDSVTLLDDDVTWPAAEV